MEILAIIYFVIGFIVAITFYIRESKKVGKVDVPVANVTTMFVWVLWPLALVIFIIRWVQIH
jgi:predicted transporter